MSSLRLPFVPLDTRAAPKVVDRAILGHRLRRALGTREGQSARERRTGRGASHDSR